MNYKCNYPKVIGVIIISKYMSRKIVKSKGDLQLYVTKTGKIRLRKRFMSTEA